MKRARVFISALVGVAIFATIVPSVMPTADAGEIFSISEDRYEATDGTPVPRWSYDNFGNSVRKAGCDTYPGLTMGGKVWASTYLDAHTEVKLKFKFWTRYNEAVAIAKAGNPNLTCAQLRVYESYLNKLGEGKGTVLALRDSSCALGGAPRWCSLANAKPGMNLLNLNINERCRTPDFNKNADGTYRRTPKGYPSYRGPVSYVGLSNVNLKIDDKTDLIAAGIKEGKIPNWARPLVSNITINAPTYLNDFEMIGGWAYLDPNDKRPANEPGGGNTYNQYVGMGKVQTPYASELFANWIYAKAKALHLEKPKQNPNPDKNFLAAAQDIQNRITTNPTGAVAQEAKQAKNGLCTNPWVPWMSDVMETWTGDNMTASQVGMDYMIRQFFDHEIAGKLGKTKIRNYPCYALQRDAIEAQAKAEISPFLQAQFFCQYGLFANLIRAIHVDDPADPSYCMNKAPSTRNFGGKAYYYSANGLAQTLDLNLGCGKEEHFKRFFGLFRELL